MIIDDLKKHEKESAFIWVVNNVRLPKLAPWEFEDRQWQIPILEDDHKQIVITKPTQVGITTIMLAKMLYIADKIPLRCIYTMPRQDDISDLVQSRLAEIITYSPSIKAKMVGTDAVRMKKYGDSWLHFLEMSVPPRMLDADLVINDEVDLSNQEHLEQVLSRLDASKYSYHFRLSTPTIDDFGIDKLYKMSDQKQWFVTCGYCSHEQSLDWSTNVAHGNGQTWYKCSRCGNKLHEQDIREGRWIATGNTNSDISGYQINQLMCTYINPNKLWVQYKTMSQKNFYNFRLGLPYTPSSGGFTTDMITDHCFGESYDKEETWDGHSTYVLGCDQGDVLHVSIGKIVDDYIEVVYLDEIPFELGFNEIGRLIRRFNIKCAIIDGLPNHHSARTLVESLPKGAMTAYFSGIDNIYNLRDIERKITINKTDAYDLLLQKIASSKLQFYSAVTHLDRDVERAIIHITNMRRDIEEQTSRIGGVKTFHVWKNVGPDHFADAVVYMLIAADVLQGNTRELDSVDITDLIQEAVRLASEFNDDFSGDAASEFDYLLFGNNSPRPRKDLEPTLRGSNSGERIKNPGLAPDNPYQLRDSLLRLYTGEG